MSGLKLVSELVSSPQAPPNFPGLGTAAFLRSHSERMATLIPSKPTRLSECSRFENGPSRPRVIFSFAFLLSLFMGLASISLVSPQAAFAALEDCGQPLSDGERPKASDALFVLRAAVGQETCDPCVCDVDSSGRILASDALRTLRFAVGVPDIVLDCIPCARCGDSVLDEGEECDPPDGTVCNDACLLCATAVEQCNGIDDNCEGGVDEGFGDVTCGLGVCERTVSSCVLGVPNPCVPGPIQSEVCDNGIDEDCNGSDCTNLSITISEPANRAVTATPSIAVVGVVDPNATSVLVNGEEALSEPGVFAAEVALREGQSTITVVASDGSGGQGSASRQVSYDPVAPTVVIDSPPTGFATAAPTITVTGIVNDIVSGGLPSTVSVNGVPAKVSNGTFIRLDVPLIAGPNTITALATDAVGNVGTASINVVSDPGAGIRASLSSGDGQFGGAGEELSAPLVVTVTDAQGSPLAGRPVAFEVTRNSGVLRSGGGQPGRRVVVTTAADGSASVNFQLGDRAGEGNNRVRATPVGAGTSAIFCASGLVSVPDRIVPVSGSNQTGLLSFPLAEPFEALVVDEDGNPIPDLNVIFRVLEGGGLFDGLVEREVATDEDGFARALLTLGPATGVNNNRAEVTFAGIDGLAANFLASAVSAGDAAATKLSGVVLDNANTPIPNAQVVVPGQAPSEFLETFTDEEGQFSLMGVEIGKTELHIDAGTTTRDEEFPVIQFETVTVAGRDNHLAIGPIRVPMLTSEKKVVGGPEDVTLFMDGVPGFSLEVFANSTTFPGGDPTGLLSINQVHLDKVPMPPPAGAISLPPAWTIQPSGVLFDPPARITIPNNGLMPGTVIDIFQFDHTNNAFVNVGPGTVTEDGSRVVSDPGFGVTRAGWGVSIPPPPPTTCAASCDDSNPCTADACEDGSCVHTPTGDGSSCGETENCVTPMCQAGACVSQTVAEACDDEDPCTEDTCEDNECAHDPAEDGTPCEDDNTCTENQCFGGECEEVESFIDGTPCDDFEDCTTDDECFQGECEGELITVEIDATVEGAQEAELAPTCRGQFSIEVVETNCPELTFDWDFGDGFTAATQNARHDYSRSGNYLAVGSAECAICSEASDADSVDVEVGPGLELVSVSPTPLKLGQDATITYRVTGPADPFDSVRLDISNKNNTTVFDMDGLPKAAGTYNVTWPEGKWGGSNPAFPGAFANPNDNPYTVQVIGNKGAGCEVIAEDTMDTRLIIEFDAEDKKSIAPGVFVARSSGLDDLAMALKIVMKLGGAETVVSGAGAITVTGASHDEKHVEVDSPMLNTLGDGNYEVLLRDFRDQVGNFADSDGNAENGITEHKFNLEIR